MAEQSPDLPPPQSPQEWREIMLGVNLNADFPDAINNAMVQQPAHPHEIRRDDNSLDIIKGELAQHGMADLSPLAAPDFFTLQDFSPEEWEEVHAAQNPLLKLWSTAYVRSAESWYRAFTNRNNTVRTTEAQRQTETAKTRSLPLIHATSFDGLLAAIDCGSFLSNRRIHNGGTDVTSSIAQTHLEDRRLGLDKFVFASFGRPAGYVRPTSISVVLEPEAMLVPGAFLTERDIMDATTTDGDLNYRGYMTEMVLAEDFYKVAQTKISNNRSLRSYYDGCGGRDYYPMGLTDFVAGSDSNPDQYGHPHFSTWEVKIPEEVPTTYIRKLLFTNPEEHNAFVQRFGDTFATQLVQPEDLQINEQPNDERATWERAAANMELYGSNQRYQQEIVQLRADEYAHRKQAIEEGESQEGHMLLHHPSTDAPDALYYDPTWYLASRKIYETAEAATAAAQRDYDPDAEHYNRVIMGEQVWVDDGYGGGHYRTARYREVAATEPAIDLARVRYVGRTAIITQLQKIQLGS